ncbi:AAA family ATPase [Lacunimicrobium album]
MLRSLTLTGTGPTAELTAEFGERLNIITGDNSLGKSFLLDLCFWCLTGTWPGARMARPQENSQAPTIKYKVASKTTEADRKADFDFESWTWHRQRGRPPMAGLVIYAAVDGSFSVWDPARNYWRGTSENDDEPRAYLFEPERIDSVNDITSSTMPRDVANGLWANGKPLCNGLISDWSNWYHQNGEPFRLLKATVESLSHPREPLECVAPVRLDADDPRSYPALKTRSGVLAYPQWSASVKRIVKIAYLLVWAWTEHENAARLKSKGQTTDQVILIIDEVESHLHPKWQRTIFPAILSAFNSMKAGLNLQVISATHSPLVLASLEPRFDEQIDHLFLFDWDNTTQQITFEEQTWIKYGDAVGWLTSPIFGLEQARSKPAEIAIEAAEAFARGDLDQLPEHLSTRDEITSELKRLLPALDPFWPRWLMGSKQ